MFKATVICALLELSKALYLNDDQEGTCQDVTEVFEPMNIWRDGTVIENTVFYG